MAAVAFLVVTNPVVVAAVGTVTSADIVNGTIKGKDIKDDAVRGKQVDESTLDTVPRAAKLADKGPGAYLNKTYRYELPLEAAAASQLYGFPGLPNGTYLVTTDLRFGTVASGENVVCSIQVGPDVDALGFGSPSGDSAFSSLTLATVLEVDAAPLMSCSSNESPDVSWSVAFGDPSVVTFTRIDTLVEAGPAS